jgi:hypothetical protein
LDRAAGAPFSGIRSNRRRLSLHNKRFYYFEIYAIFLFPEALCAPRRLLCSEDAMSFTAILVSILIAFGLIFGAVILVFVGVAAMAREARD